MEGRAHTAGAMEGRGHTAGAFPECCHSFLNIVTVS